MEKKVIYYEDNRGRKPAKEFINAFETKTKAKILARIGYLQEHWHEARRPLVDYVGEDLYEVRVEFAWNTVRVIYAYMFKNYIVILHGLQKKSKKIPRSDILIAKKRMIDFQVRYNEGKISLRS